MILRDEEKVQAKRRGVMDPRPGMGSNTGASKHSAGVDNNQIQLSYLNRILVSTPSRGSKKKISVFAVGRVIFDTL